MIKKFATLFIKIFSRLFVFVIDINYKIVNWWENLEKWGKVSIVSIIFLVIISIFNGLLIYCFLNTNTVILKIVYCVIISVILAIFEYLIRFVIIVFHHKRNDIKYYSWNYLSWGMPFVFSFVIFIIASSNSLLKEISGLLTLIFLVLFYPNISNYLDTTKFGHKKINFIWLVFITFILFFIIGLTLDDRIILLWPFLIILVYFKFAYYLNIPQRQRNSYYNNFINEFQKSWIISSWLNILLLAVLAMYIFKVWASPHSLSSLYTISITVYIFILSVTATFITISLKGKIKNQRRKYLRNAFSGFAEMCIAFILISLFGILLGIDNYSLTTFFTSTKLSITLFKGDVILNIKIFLQIISLEFIILSFAPSLMYLYAMVRQVLNSI